MYMCIEGLEEDIFVFKINVKKYAVVRFHWLDCIAYLLCSIDSKASLTYQFNAI